MGESTSASTKKNPAKLPESHPPEPPRVQAEIDKFVKAADGLVSTAPVALWTLQAAHRGARKDYTNFFNTKCVNKRTKDGATVADVPPGLFHEYKVIQRRLDRSSIATKVIENSCVVSLVSQYDSFLGGLLRAFFHLRPELPNACDRTLTLRELQTFESIEAAVKSAVEKEVETVIRKSHVEQFEWMEKRFDISLRKGLSVWPRFVELTERRNLLVHCGGIVSSQYLALCQQNQVECEGTVGTELLVSRDYIVQAYECLSVWI